jgi:hypothetical protein
VKAGYFLPHRLSSATGFDDRKRKRVHEKSWSIDPLGSNGARADSERPSEEARSSLRKLRRNARVWPVQRGGGRQARRNRDVPRRSRRRSLPLVGCRRASTAGLAWRSDEEPRSMGRRARSARYERAAVITFAQARSGLISPARRRLKATARRACVRAVETTGRGHGPSPVDPLPSTRVDPKGGVGAPTHETAPRRPTRQRPRRPTRQRPFSRAHLSSAGGEARVSFFEAQYEIIFFC